jgi:hypothetical protein
MGHFNAYGGPKPPPIDHEGIDDAFIEKAPVTWYFHNGAWLRLTGADMSDPVQRVWPLSREPPGALTSG